MNKAVYFIIVLFSFFLGFGRFDPFGTGGLFFDLITLFLMITIAFYTDVFKEIGLYKKTLMALCSIVMLFFITGLLYGYAYVDVNLFNFKFLSAIIIFWFLSYIFKKKPKLCLYSIILFSLSCSLIAILYNFGFLNSVSEIRNGRLYVFEENPNSISSRMAIAFVVLTYIIIENPLHLKFYRFFLGIALPSLFLFVVETGSRGSFVGLLLGVGLFMFLSNLNVYIKFFLGIVSVFLFIKIFDFIQTTVLFDRLNAGDVSGGREEIWTNALEIFYDFPWGVGEGGYITEMTIRFSSQYDTHNLFIYILVCGGWLSLLLFLYFLKELFQKALINLKKGNSLLLIIFVFLVFLASKTGGVITYLIMWYFFAVINSFDIMKKKRI
jgi:hypothetical protein